jgi:hypothetical protein
MKYLVGITIYNCFEIEADSEEEAEEQARELDVYQTLDDADYNITYVDEIKEIKKRNIPREMCEDLLKLHHDKTICDDEHGNTL